jgi:hypothetical protein
LVRQRRLLRPLLRRHGQLRPLLRRHRLFRRSALRLRRPRAIPGDPRSDSARHPRPVRPERRTRDLPLSARRVPAQSGPLGPIRQRRTYGSPSGFPGRPPWPRRDPLVQRLRSRRLRSCRARSRMAGRTFRDSTATTRAVSRRRKMDPSWW